MRKDIVNDNFDKNMESINEDIFIALFRKAAHEYLKESFLEDISDSTELEDYTFSDNFEKRMNKLIQRAIRKERKSRVRKMTIKIAVGFIIFLALSSAVVMSAEALRVRVFNFLIDIKEKATDINIVDEDKDANNYSNSAIHPAYIPEGYEQTSTEQFSNKITLIYTNEVGKMIVIRRYDGDANISIDTENAEYGNLMINGYEAFCSVKDGMTVLLFRTEDYTFSIVGELSIEVTIEIAENIN